MSTVKQGDYEKNDDKPKIGCCGWFLAEVNCCCCCGKRRVSMFSTTDANGQDLDLHKSFNVGASYPVIVLKFILWALTVSTYIYGYVDYTHDHWFMAYISYWTLAYKCVYMTSSLLLALWKSPWIRLIYATWVMYLIVAVHGMIVVLLFWFTEYGPDYTLSYFIIMSHGVTFGLVVLDGWLLNRTPVRLQHYIFSMILGLVFVGWTMLQAYLPIQNPWKVGLGDDEQGLYNILDWRSAPVEAAIVSFVVIFIAMPIFTVFFWGLSLLRSRQYVVPNNNDDEEGPSDTEAAEATAPEIKMFESDDC